MNHFASLLFIITMGACGNLGSCGACGSTGPLPNGKLPTDQTVEGGAQVRVTPQGFSKLSSILPGLLNQQLSSGFCLPKGSAGVSLFNFDIATAKYCQSGGGCSGGCKITAQVNTPNGLTTQVVGNNLRVNLSTKIDTTIPIDFVVFGVTVDSCNMRLQSSNLNGSFDVGFGIKPADGELDIKLANINSFTTNLQWSGCGIISDIGQLLTTLIDAIPNTIKGFLTPLLNPLIQSFIPNPLGVKGMVNIGSLLEGISPGTDGFMEARIVPGGYVGMTANGGMNMGVITGMNADEDPATRTVALDSEPALCVPPMPAPVFSLPTVARSGLGGNTFQLAPAGQFSGNPDPAADIAMGLSKTTLNLTGHHLVTSGGMCLGVGTSYIKQLNVGTIGILVPSLGELASDEGNDPLLLVTRPQKAVDFSIGTGTMTDPNLTIHLRNIEVDFYAFLYERYVRAFTLELTMNVGINMTFEQPASGPAVIKPELVGISSSEVQVKVLNSQFVRETPQHLEGVLPSVFDLVTPLLGQLPPIQVPSFAGFSLNNLSIQKVTTSQDEFLALYASLGSSPMMRVAADNDPFMRHAVDLIDEDAPSLKVQSTGKARLLAVDTPPAEIIRGALVPGQDGQLPSVTFDVDRYDTMGRELEWTWNINGGLYRPYQPGGQLIISDRAFAWQGKYEIGLKSRVKGDYHTVSDEIRTAVVIDSVGPRVFEDKTEWDGDQMKIHVWDVVDGKDIEIAFGAVGDDAPQTKWVPAREATLALITAKHLADLGNGDIAVFARDQQGNQTIAYVAPFHGQAGASGCSCDSGKAPSAGSLALFGLVGLGLFGRRRRRSLRISPAAKRMMKKAAKQLGFVACIALLSAFIPACSCGKGAGQSCETAEDCGPDFCEEGQLPFCVDNECVCSDDIPPGRIGPYSDVGVGGGAIWVSAYAESHGDLVVAQTTGGRIPNEAWEWVDGVPDGPVVIPGSKIRGGIEEKGADVGMYTSIAVASDGTPMVTYFDVDTASLKFATKSGGVWTTHIVEQGTSKIDPGSGGSLVGMYTSLTLRSDDGRPGVAYLAHVKDGAGERAEVRYAAAQTANPTSSADWQFWTVDKANIPANPDEVYPLPGGLGLFIDSARNPTNQAPVVTYYDRTNGDLKVSKFNPTSGQFATAIVLDGTNGIDAGWSPSVGIDANGVVNVAYVGATSDDLKFTTDATNAPKETIDDGYRIDGITVDGLPKPVYHFVGDDAGLVLAGANGPRVVYQDATTQEMLLAEKGQDGKWTHTSIAGGPQVSPWPGAYGFFASAALSPTDIVMSTWVVNQPEDDNWVEVFLRPITIARQQ
ncbi:MAG TPA: MYXO-CTERM sorting domain-containing protein [Kofleriaceae bacterium]|nr:MYXO-CTERM sorting domain-containing protein [Kofleriaceae bacterium]